jgi:hypothetical protein
MRVRIINEDGKGFSTRVVNVDTGEEIMGIVEIEPIVVDEMVKVRITVVPDRIDLISEEVQWAVYCPHCGASLDSYRKKK